MPQVRTPADLGALAAAGRAARGWSQQEAADAAGVSRRFVNLLESGRHVNAELWRVLALLDALGVQVVGAVPSGSPAEAGGDGGPPWASTEPAAPDDFDLDAHLSAFRAGDEQQ
jgi:transcriptional regulator with XRE-family HTH domain